jgi:hypothetical protein
MDFTEAPCACALLLRIREVGRKKRLRFEYKVNTNYECDVAPNNRTEEISLPSSLSSKIGALLGIE